MGLWREDGSLESSRYLQVCPEVSRVRSFECNLVARQAVMLRVLSLSGTVFCIPGGKLFTPKPLTESSLQYPGLRWPESISSFVVDKSNDLGA